MKPLKEILTTTYDIHELEAFFKNRSLNVSFMNPDFRNLSFEEVDERFPVEVIRPGGYSVYSVAQGGCYYVFWALRDVDSISNTTSVYFCAYLPSRQSISSPDSIKQFCGTFEDVLNLAPSTELNPMLSSGIYSYSYINADQLLQIKYRADSTTTPNGLLVKENKLISRVGSPSMYSLIFEMDLP